jgi:hypothetical protein
MHGNAMHLLEIGTHGHTTRCDVLLRSKRYVHDKGDKKHTPKNSVFIFMLFFLSF